MTRRVLVRARVWRLSVVMLLAAPATAAPQQVPHAASVEQSGHQPRGQVAPPAPVRSPQDRPPRGAR